MAPHTWVSILNIQLWRKIQGILVCFIAVAPAAEQKAPSACHLDLLNLSSPIKTKKIAAFCQDDPMAVNLVLIHTKRAEVAAAWRALQGKIPALSASFLTERSLCPALHLWQYHVWEEDLLNSHKLRILAKSIHSSLTLYSLTYVPVVIKHQPFGAVPPWKIASW